MLRSPPEQGEDVILVVIFFFWRGLTMLSSVKKINKNMHETVIKTWVVYYLTFKFFLLSGFSVHPFHIQLLLDARFRPHFDISAHLKHLPFVLSPQDCVFISQSF